MQFYEKINMIFEMSIHVRYKTVNKQPASTNTVVYSLK